MGIVALFEIGVALEFENVVVLFLGNGNEAFVSLVAEGCFSKEAAELSAFEVVVKNVRQWFGDEVGFGEGGGFGEGAPVVASHAGFGDVERFEPHCEGGGVRLQTKVVIRGVVKERVGNF